MNDSPAPDPTGLAARAERDYLTYARSFGRVPGISILDDGELLARRGEPVHDYLTLVLGTWTTDENVDAVVDGAIERIGGPGRPFTWSVWPSNGPASLRDRLVRRGFAHLGEGPLMTIDLQTADLPTEPPDGLVIERVTDPAVVREAARTAMTPGQGESAAGELFHGAYDLLIGGPEPEMRYFTGRIDGRIVATSALYTGTGLAGIYAVGTAAEQRGRGFGRALTAAALLEGRRLGYDTGALLSSELGFPVYRRLGFETVGTVGFYASPG